MIRKVFLGKGAAEPRAQMWLEMGTKLKSLFKKD